MGNVEELLDIEMRGKLDAAAQKGCSAEGHQGLVEYLVLSHQLHVDTRKDVREIKGDVQEIRRLAERKGALFGEHKWGKPVKAGTLGTSLLGVIYLLLDKFLSK